MQNQFLTDSISSTSKFLDTAFELAIDQEILLADYDRSVFKIVKTCVDHTITQKYINGNKLICEGYFRISVFYQPPQEDKLTVITKKQPFRHQLDLSVPVQSPYFLPVYGSLQYVNTRAISPTRISVSGVYSFTAKVYGTQQTAVISAVSSHTACTDSNSQTYFTLSGARLRQFSMEDEISLPDNVDKILNMTLGAHNCTINSHQDKINVKGEAVVDIFYTTENSPQINHSPKTFLYNQVIDMPGVAENNVAYASFSITSFTVTANSDTGKTNCIITATLDAKAFRKENIILVNDCFSKNYEYEKSHKNIVMDTNISAVSKIQNFQVEDTIGSGYSPVYTVVDTSAPYISESDGKTMLKAKAIVSVIVKNENKEYECFTKTGDITLDRGTVLSAEDDVIVICQRYGADVTVSGEIMKVRFSVNLKGFIIRHKKDKVLTEFTENHSAPVSNPADALILYYGDKGENLFDIAMKYKTDMAVIMAENNLDEKILAEEKILLIPAYRQ